MSGRLFRVYRRTGFKLLYVTEEDRLWRLWGYLYPNHRIKTRFYRENAQKPAMSTWRSSTLVKDNRYLFFSRHYRIPKHFELRTTIKSS